jgi:hypothetical protein
MNKKISAKKIGLEAFMCGFALMAIASLLSKQYASLGGVPGLLPGAGLYIIPGIAVTVAGIMTYLAGNTMVPRSFVKTRDAVRPVSSRAFFFTQLSFCLVAMGARIVGVSLADVPTGFVTWSVRIYILATIATVMIPIGLGLIASIPENLSRLRAWVNGE